MPKSSNQKNSFRFRTGIDLGSGVAELDNVQDECFLFTDAYQAISDHENHLCVIVGKAGSGKSAIIRQLLLEKSNNIIRIHPQQLAFHFLRGSELLASLRQTGINMSLFYKLLWRHVFIIEILKHMFPEEVQLPGPFSGILTKLHIKRRNKKRDLAFEYIEKWGHDFFQDTEHRIQEITNTLETDIRAEIKVSGTWPGLFGLSGAADGNRFSGQKIREHREVAQKVVEQIQITHLYELFAWLKEDVLTDDQNPCYIVIDDLDKPWVGAEVEHDLIAALLEEAMEFHQLANVKIVVALRDNILHR
jgi:hypothetical protein